MNTLLTIFRDTTRRRIVYIFLLLQAFVLIRNYDTSLFSFYWYCDFTPALFALLFLFGNTQAVKGLLNIGFFAQVSYTVVIVTKVLFDITLFHFVFDFPLTFQYVLPTIIIHLSTIFAFFVTYKIRPTVEALVYSVIFLCIIFGVVKLFSHPTGTMLTNYNFIFDSNSLSFIPYYSHMWVLLTFILVVLPTQLFQFLTYRTYRHYKTVK